MNNEYKCGEKPRYKPDQTLILNCVEYEVVRIVTSWTSIDIVHMYQLKQKGKTSKETGGMFYEGDIYNGL